MSISAEVISDYVYTDIDTYISYVINTFSYLDNVNWWPKYQFRFSSWVNMPETEAESRDSILVHTLHTQDGKCCSPWRGTQTLPRRSFLFVYFRLHTTHSFINPI